MPESTIKIRSNAALGARVAIEARLHAAHPGAGPKAGPAWGVTSLPPGMDLHDEHIVAAIERQQKR